MVGDLASKAVQGPALTLQCIHDIEGSDCLAAAVLGVGDSVTDDVLQEDLEDTCWEAHMVRTLLADRGRVV